MKGDKKDRRTKRYFNNLSLLNKYTKCNLPVRLYVIYDNLCVGKLLPLIITIYKSRFVLPGEPIVLTYCGNSGARKALSLLFDLFKAFD